MRHAFDTKRMRVMVVRFDPGGGNMLRDLYIGLMRTEEQVYPVVYATVSDLRKWGDGAASMIDYYGTPIVLDMIETNDLYRRNGLAREMISGVESYLKLPVHGDGVTDAGVGLMQSIETTD